MEGSSYGLTLGTMVFAGNEGNHEKSTPK